MAVTILLTASTILLAIWLYKRLFSQRKDGETIPGPVGLPILGSSLSVNLAKIHLSFYDWATKYGRVFRVSLFGQGIVVLNDIDLMKKALTDDQYAANYLSHPQSFIGKYVVYGNKDIAFSLHYDKTFLTLKKMLIKALRQYSEDNKTFEIIIHEELSRVIDAIKKTNGDDFVLKPLVRQSFGNLMSVMLSGALPQGNDSEMIWEFNDALFYIAENSVNLMLKVLPFLRHVKQTKSGRAFQKVIAQRTWIENRYFYSVDKQTDNGTAGLVETLIRLSHEENKKAGHEIVTEDNLKSVLLDIVAGGMTSTTNAILSSVAILLDNPECVTKIQAEIDDVIGRDRLPSMDDKHHMPYTSAYILETLRYISHGTIGLPHEVARDHNFEGYHMRKTDIVFSNIWFVHKDVTLWEDPWTFRPDRFLDSDGDLVPVTHPNRQNLVTFSMGRHKCPGNDFSVGKMFLYITSILQTFHVKQSSSHTHNKVDPREFLPGLFLEPELYYLKMEPRE